MSWATSTTRIGRLCSISSSKRIHAREYEETGVPFYRGKEIIEKHRGALTVSVEKFISEKRFREIELKHGAPQSGDLLLTSVGTLGVPYVVKAAERFYFKDGNLTWFRDFEGLDVRFLYFWLLSPAGKEQLKRFTIGSSQPAFTIAGLNDMEIDVPPLPTQQRIASILSAYDDLIETNTRRIAILEEMARRLYEEWFVHFRFPGHEEAEFDETELGRTPHGWRVQTVAQTFEITGGGTPSKKVEKYWADGTIDWFSPTDLTRAGTMFMDGSSSKITALGLRKSSARLFPPFSVMMTSRATIGAIAINTTEACTNQGFITCIPNGRFPLYLLLHWLRDNVEMFISLASGATFKEISKGVFKEIKLLVPPHDIGDRFERTVGPMMHEALVLQRKNANLRAQRDLLLPKLVSGEIDVSGAEAALEAAE